MANSELSSIETRLKVAMKISGQSRYQREQPDPDSIRELAEVRAALRNIVESEADNHQAWDLLSLAEECLLAFRSAKQCLQTKCNLLDQVSKKDRKRLALLDVAIREAEILDESQSHGDTW